MVMVASRNNFRSQNERQLQNRIMATIREQEERSRLMQVSEAIDDEISDEDRNIVVSVS